MSSNVLVHQDLQKAPECSPNEDVVSITFADEEITEMHKNPNQSWPTFPPECLQIVRLMEGNKTCVDCQGYDGIGDVIVEPMYASITHGTLVCQNCASGHINRDERAFGIKSFMDEKWYLPEVLSLLEGGNNKFREFCAITNSYPNLESAVSDKKQFFDGLYASKPVKAYRSLLRKAVAKTHHDRKVLVNNHDSPRSQQAPAVTEQAAGQDSGTYIKEVPMLSVYDFHTTIIKKEWPSKNAMKYSTVSNWDKILYYHENGTLRKMGNSFDKSTTDLFTEDTTSIEKEDNDACDGSINYQKSHEETGEKLSSETEDAYVNEEENELLLSGDDALKCCSTKQLSDDTSQNYASSIDNQVLSANLTATEATEHSSTTNGGNDVEREILYTESLKAENSISSKPRRTRRHQLSSVPETMATAERDDFSLTSKHELKPTKNGRNASADDDDDDDDDDNRSLQSFGSSVASSFGSFDVRSIDSHSIASADVEPMPKVDKEDEMVKNLEPNLNKESSQDIENIQETDYGPQSTGRLARNLHELEEPESKLDLNEIEKDSSGSQNDSSNGKSIAKRSSLQLTMEKLEESIEEANATYRRRPSSYIERMKSIASNNLRESPQAQQQQDKRKNRVKPMNTGVTGTLFEYFRPNQLKGGNDSNHIAFRPRDKKTEFQGTVIDNIMSRKTNGRLGPPVKKKSDYTPLIRHSVAKGTIIREEITDEHRKQKPTVQRVQNAYRHRMKRLSKSFLSQTTRVQESKIKSETSCNLAPRGRDELEANFALRKNNKTNNGNSQIGLALRRPFVGSTQ